MTDWAEIVRQNGPLVWKVAYRLLNHDADAADCFQNAFVAAFRVASSQDVRNWPALLQHLATIEALARLRQRYRAASRLVELSSHTRLDARTVDPARAAGANELAEDLSRALSTLEPRQAEAFCLVCLEGLTYSDVASRLNVTVNHVGVLLNRAKAKLRTSLRAHHDALLQDAVKREPLP